MTLRVSEVRSIDQDLKSLGPLVKRNLVTNRSMPITPQPPGTAWSSINYSPSQLARDWNYRSIAVHHSGNSGKKDPVDILNLRLGRGYPDIGYHYLLHPNGTIFEGTRISCKGSHVGGANTGKIGVLMMGDFDHQWWDFDDTLSKSHIVKLRAVIEVLQKHFIKIDTLGGHREFLPGKGYSCPGSELMPQVTKLRADLSLNAP